ncbi:MAG: cupin domain-containing protein [Candidatus Latescibacter sp.]|nr:cupin domain-containing protein [Candidatus Latescibacter sp.]
MKRLLMLTAALFTITFIPGYTQDKAPSYFELDDYNHRYPATDTNIDFYLQNWKNSPVYNRSVMHGGWIERPYLTPGDPANPSRPGAVLKYIKAYNHGALDPATYTQKTKHDKEQVFFYITEGVGRVEAGGKKADLSEGTGVFIPAGLTYQFFNTDKEQSLQAVIVVEDITEGFQPLKEMKTGSYKDHMPGAGMHWAHIGRGIVDGVKFSNPMGIAVVSVAAWDMAQPHMHGPGCEEIWCQLKGTSLLLFGNQLRRQEPGMAFLIPPTFKIPHSSINGTDEPMQWLYLGNRHDPQETRKMEGHIPGWKDMIYKKYDEKY